MSLKKVSKNQPEIFKFSEKNLEIAKKIISNYTNEINYFYQVCPKEMLDKIDNPVTIKDKIDVAI